MIRLRTIAATVLVAGLTAAPLWSGRADAPSANKVVATYADIAQAMYTDAHHAAMTLKAAVDAFLADPTEETLAKARQAWLAARVPYQQTEGYRFGNKIVDDWEGRVNSWPLDEGLIDYVDRASYGDSSDENPLYTANVIANPSLKLGKKTIDAKVINAKLLESLQEAGEVEANVATGYHAIEFLLWGQDLNGTGPGAGKRPATDFSLKNCTGGHCDRRRAYLQAVTDLLVKDLTTMADAWGAKGKARTALVKKGPEQGLATILTGLGSLSYGELAGERIKLGLLLHDPEEEHDCFSDNTHNSHYYDQIGMMAIWNAHYQRLDGSTVAGPSLADLTRAKAPEAAARLDEAMATTKARMEVMKATADSGKMAYDQMLAADNAEGNKILLDVVDALIAQTRAVEGVVAALKLKIKVEGSDSLDDPSAVTR
ncbi:MAG: imelysin family protein [Rhodospirillales bacterium]